MDQWLQKLLTQKIAYFESVSTMCGLNALATASNLVHTKQ
jgi:hypothetical protein